MKHAQKIRSLVTCTILIAVSFLTAPINCQYLITANDSYCLAIGTHSLSNKSQAFWTNISDSANCINWAFEKHFNHETQSIYNGQLHVSGIGPNAINQQSYLNQRMFIDDTDFEFIQAQS
eukprot:917677_1